MKLSKLIVENFCRISFVDLALGEHVTEISGPNGSGKTSSLNALWVLLKGKRVAPEEPIHKGAARCRIQGQLGDYVVTRTFQKDKHGEITTSLRIERGEEGMPPTEAFMRELIGEHMLDPGDFINLTPAEKFDVFRSFVPGVDFKLIANQNRKDYDRRTEVNRAAKEQRAAANLIQLPEDCPQEEVDVERLLGQLRRAADENVDIERRRANREKAVGEIERLREIARSGGDRIAVYELERNEQRDREVTALEEQIAVLQQRISDAREACRLDVERRTKDLAEGAAKAAADAEALQEKLDKAGALPEPADLAALERQISAARATNELVGRSAERNRHVQLAEQYERESEEITTRMQARERSKQEAIAKAHLPIAGITFSDEEVLLNGVPFEQASTALKLKCGVAIAVAKNPTLRLVWIRDASLLDDKSYAQVEQLARECDAQILLETVRPIGQDAIVLEDGQIKPKKANAQKKPAAEGVPA